MLRGVAVNTASTYEGKAFDKAGSWDTIKDLVKESTSDKKAFFATKALDWALKQGGRGSISKAVLEADKPSRPEFGGGTFERTMGMIHEGLTYMGKQAASEAGKHLGRMFGGTGKDIGSIAGKVVYDTIAEELTSVADYLTTPEVGEDFAPSREANARAAQSQVDATRQRIADECKLGMNLHQEFVERHCSPQRSFTLQAEVLMKKADELRERERRAVLVNNEISSAPGNGESNGFISDERITKFEIDFPGSNSTEASAAPPASPSPSKEKEETPSPSPAPSASENPPVHQPSEGSAPLRNEGSGNDSANSDGDHGWSTTYGYEHRVKSYNDDGYFYQNKKDENGNPTK